MMKYFDLQGYFKERLLELFHKDTLDSYRVRNNNALSLLFELQDLIIGWRENRIKLFSTVQSCISETIQETKNDQCLNFDFLSKKKFVEKLEDYKSKGESNISKAERMLFSIQKCINHNKPHYLKALFEKLESIIFNDSDFKSEDFMKITNELDTVITSLSCELLHRGYSKRFLYTHFAKSFDNVNSEHFRDRFEQHKDFFTDSVKNVYTVIFKLTIPKDILGGNIVSEFVSNVDGSILDEYRKNKYSKFLSTGISKYFYIHNCEALDLYSATSKAKEKLLSLLDILHLGLCNLKITTSDNVLVFFKSKGRDSSVETKTQIYLDGSFTNDISLSIRFKSDLDKIINNQNIGIDVKDRINSALRHLRMGNTHTEIEQCFINYWIALEFIFSSPITGESTYSRLHHNLKNILTCCYVKRNLLALNETCIKKRVIESGTQYWTNDMDVFIEQQASLHLRYRLLQMKSRLFNNSDKKKKYIKNHEQNLDWHITRIYRLRNELIHEAAIKQNIDSITSNLRYYLVFILNQIIVYFSNIENGDLPCTLEHFFYEYEMWKEKIAEEWAFDTLMEVPVEMDLLK